MTQLLQHDQKHNHLMCVFLVHVCLFLVSGNTREQREFPEEGSGRRAVRSRGGGGAGCRAVSEAAFVLWFAYQETPQPSVSSSSEVSLQNTGRGCPWPEGSEVEQSANPPTA